MNITTIGRSVGWRGRSRSTPRKPSPAGTSSSSRSRTRSSRSPAGPIAQAFNTNFAVLYDEIDKERVRPSNLYTAEDEAREVTEQLIRDAGFDPVSLEGLDQAGMLKDHVSFVGAINQAGLGRFFYRYAAPGELWRNRLPKASTAG